MHNSHFCDPQTLLQAIWVTYLFMLIKIWVMYIKLI